MERERSRATLAVRRLAWFVALWCAGVAAVGTLAWLLRLWIAPG
jgi:hypothetical protein